MIGRMLRAIAAVLVLSAVAASGPATMTGQLLAYQDGFVFFTNGAGFRVEPGVKILNDVVRTPATELPRARLYARAVFDPAGAVAELDLSHAPLPIEPLTPQLAALSVQQTPSYPNPDLAQPPSNYSGTSGAGSIEGSGRPVLVVVTVQVPPLTPPAAQIFITTDSSGWNPQAIQMDRIDALHFRITRRLAAGTVMNYLYTRGSFQTQERAQNGLQREPRHLVITDADVRAVNDTVYNWADAITGSQSAQPNAIPTPYNPAPFPNLPAGYPTPHPRD